MADVKISALTPSTTPLAGTEVLPIVQSGVTKKVSVADLTAGRAISATEVTLTTGNLIIGTSGKGINTIAAQPLTFGINSQEAFRVDQTKSICIGDAGNFGAKVNIAFDPSATNGLLFAVSSGTFTNNYVYFQNSGGSQIGSISSNNSSVAYNTTSDHRVKQNIQPIANAIEKIMQLNPVTYDWKPEFAEGSGQGFVAHELQQIIPEAVNGEKDAVDTDGKPKYQGIDTSFVIPMLTAAIKEQQAIIESLQARLDAANL